MMPALIDLIGRRFGRLTVTGPAGVTAYGQRSWDCVCDCGNGLTVFGNSLRSGATQSCGCLRLERITKHGKTGSAEFSIWQMMIQRCENPAHVSYESYGGRGITVCDRWGTFAAFLADMGVRPSPSHTLDRKDNDGPYSPENCRWATAREQGQNKRNNHFLTRRGETLTLSEWCRRLGLKKSTVLNRLARGSDDEEALSLADHRIKSG